MFNKIMLILAALFFIAGCHQGTPNISEENFVILRKLPRSTPLEKLPESDQEKAIPDLKKAAHKLLESDGLIVSRCEYLVGQKEFDSLDKCIAEKKQKRETLKNNLNDVVTLKALIGDIPPLDTALAGEIFPAFSQLESGNKGKSQEELANLASQIGDRLIKDLRIETRDEFTRLFNLGENLAKRLQAN